MMIGRPLETAFPTIADAPPGEVLLQVSQLRGRRFGPIDLELRRGEIVGIAGAEGNGQVQLLRALAGVEPSHGTVTCAGKRVHLTTPPGAIRAGIILLSADRKRESIFTALSVRANATLQVLASTPGSASSPASGNVPRSTTSSPGCGSRRPRSSSRRSTSRAATSRRWR